MSMVQKSKNAVNSLTQMFDLIEGIRSIQKKCSIIKYKEDDVKSVEAAFTDIVNVISKYDLKDDTLIIGGFALILNGYPRTTEDIDLIVKSTVLDKIKKGMIELGYEYTIGEDKWGVTMIKFVNGKKIVDIVNALEFYQKKAIKDDQKILRYNNIEVRFLKPGVLIEFKLKAIANNENRVFRKPDINDITTLVDSGIFNETEIEGFIKLGLAYGIDKELLNKIFFRP